MRVTTESPMVTRTEVAGREYVAKQGIFQMPDEHARLYLKATEQAALSLAGVGRRALGFRCVDPRCDFASYFKTCSKCGGPCRRETEENPDGSTAQQDRKPPLVAGW